jgi:acetyltransferase-like isoleucine patch superfamily enzyme
MLKILKILWEYLRRFLGKIKNAVIIIKLKYKYSATIGRGCKISSDFKCGQNIKISDNANIGKNVIVGSNVTIGGNSIIRQIEVGDNSHLEGGVKIIGKGRGKIVIGKETYVGINNVLDFSDNISIGDFVHIAGPSTGLWTHSSARQAVNELPLADKNIDYRPTAPIIIENAVYIGGNTTIYPGIVIGHHSIISPNSAVTKSFEPYSMVGGVPAKLIKKLANFLSEE